MSAPTSLPQCECTAAGILKVIVKCLCMCLTTWPITQPCASERIHHNDVTNVNRSFRLRLGKSDMLAQKFSFMNTCRCRDYCKATDGSKFRYIINVFE